MASRVLWSESLKDSRRELLGEVTDELARECAKEVLPAVQALEVEKMEVGRARESENGRLTKFWSSLTRCFALHSCTSWTS